MPPLLELPFTNGLDQGTDPRRTVKFITLDNYVWTKRGMIEKRSGYSSSSIPLSIIGDAYSSVASATITAGGSGWGSIVDVETVGGGGSGFIAFTATVGGIMTLGPLAIANPGYGYTSLPTLKFVGSGTGGAGTLTLTAPSGAGGSLSNIFAIAETPQSDLEVCDGNTVYRLSSEGWIPLGALASKVGVTTTPLPIIGSSAANSSTSLQAINWDVAYANGYACYGFQCFGYAGILVLDAATSAIVAGPPVGVDSPTNAPVVVSDGRYFWIMWADPGAGGGPVAMFVTVDTSFTPPLIGTVTTFETLSSIPAITLADFCWNPVASNLLVGYEISGSNQVTLASFTYDGYGLNDDWTQVATITTVATASNTVIAVAVGASGNTYLAWSYVNSGTLHVYAYQSNTGDVPIYSVATSVTASVSNLTIVETNPSGSEYHVAFTAIDANGVDQVQSFRVSASGFSGVVVSETVTCGLTLGSRAYCPSTGVAHALTYSLAGQGYFISDISGTDTTLTGITQAVPLASINPRVAFTQAANLHADIRYIGSLVTPHVNNSIWQIPVTISSDPGETEALNLQLASIAYDAVPGPPAIEWTSLIYPAGISTVVGVEQVFEANFMAPPVILSVTASGSGPILPGAYAYVATFERVADDGSIIQSPTSLPFTITLTGSAAQIYVLVTTYSIGKSSAASKDIAGAFIVLYRTQAGGTEYTRVSVDPYNFGTGDGSAPNFPTVSAITIVDGNGNIAPNLPLYTEGGVFDNVCPPACSIVTRIRDRIYLTGTPDGFTVYYSDAVQSTGTSNFHDEQTIVIDDDGPITGVGAVDSNTFIFKSGAIYVVYGVEGNNTGSGNTLSNPTKVPTGGIGCISASSIIAVPQGLMFQSARGIELLDRNVTIQFIGEPVKDVTHAEQVVSAIEVPTQYQVRFFLSNGIVAVYSTNTGEWSTFSYPFVAGGPICSTTYQGVVVWASEGPTIQQEIPGQYSDDGNWITSAFETGQITLSEGLQGYRRYKALQLFGQWAGESGVSVSIASDYAPSAAQTNAWTSTQIEAIPGFNGILQLEVRPMIQKAETVQISFADTIPDDTTLTKGIVWESLSFEVVEKQGRYRGLSSSAKG
jgi:hypothetical protein